MDWFSLVELNCSIKIERWKSFLSRRNKVMYIEGINKRCEQAKYAVKIYLQGEPFLEPFILQELADSGVGVPKVVWHNGNIMVTEFISGTTLGELILNEGKAAFLMMEALARWFNNLHSIRNDEGYHLSMPDLNLRNFIYNGEAIFGLDFEEIRFGFRERDLGGVAAYILNHDPMFEPWKYDLVYYLFKKYETMGKIDRGLATQYFFEEMKKAAERRDREKDFLLEKVRELEAEKYSL